ncbi:MAG TPA: ORF6N domain-containing protein [Prolixibacteraceae bacterium]
MTKVENQIMLPEATIISKIFFIRGKKIMLDRDLANFYGIETRRLKEQVRRNPERFPDDFMIEFTKEELENFRKQFGNSNKEIMGLRIPPFAFTEHGILMLASVLNTERAIKVNIQLVRIFNKMREMLQSNKELIIALEQLRDKINDHDDKFILIFDYLKKFDQNRKQQLTQANRKRIGY